jgi:hypothetical protein
MIIRNKVGKLKFNIIFRYQGDGIDKDSIYEKTVRLANEVLS